MQKNNIMTLQDLIEEGCKYGENPLKDFFGNDYKVNESLQESFLVWARKVLAFIENYYPKSGNIKDIRERLKSDHEECRIETYRFIISILKSLEEPNNPVKVTPSNIEVLYQILNGFSGFVRQLNNRHDNRNGIIVKDEYDVQDILHAQFVTFFEDVRAEDPVPINAGSGSRLDFLIVDIKTAVEVKMTRKRLGDKAIGEQLLVDVCRYRKRNDIERLVFFIYDPEHHIRNPKGLKNDIEKQSGPGCIINTFVVN